MCFEEVRVLELPPVGRRVTQTNDIEGLLRQADAIGCYPEVARALVRASFEYMLSGPRWQGPDKRAVLEPHPMGLRINDWLVHVLPDAGEDSLRALAGVVRFGLDVDVLAPPWARSLAKDAVYAMDLRCPVTVYSVDCYVELRMMWTGLDLNHGAERKEAELFDRYRRLVRTMPAIDIL